MICQMKKTMTDIRFERVWAMPNSNTFDIPPIRKLIDEEVDTTLLWIDPFANTNRIARITNDLNPEYGTQYNMDALDFLKMFDDESVDGVLYDPPYSPRQVSECYKGVGMNVTNRTTQASFWSNHKKEISRIVKRGGEGPYFWLEQRRHRFKVWFHHYKDTACTSWRLA